MVLYLLCFSFLPFAKCQEFFRYSFLDPKLILLLFESDGPWEFERKKGRLDETAARTHCVDTNAR